MSSDKEKFDTSDSCFTGLGVTLKDSKVIKAINHKIQSQYVFRGYKCKITQPEVIEVHLDFDCHPERPCAIDPSLYVTVNLISKTVEKIVGADT